VLDIVNQKAIVYDPDDEAGLKYSVQEIPAELKESAEQYLAELIDAVSNKDDVIAEMVLEEKPISPQVLKAAIRRLTCKIEMVPVLGGSAFRKRGVQPLVDAVVDYLPSPLDVPPATGQNEVSGEPMSLSNCGVIRSSASWCSSASIAASSRRATSFTIRARAVANASTAS
jgi:elongation factor G